MRLIYLGGAWLLGLYLGYVSFAPSIWAYFIPVAALVLLLALRRVKALLIAVFCLALLAAGFLRGQSAVSDIAKENVSRFVGRGVVELTGKIENDPEILDRGTRFALAVEQLSLKSGAAEPASGKVLVYTSLLPPRDSQRQFPYYRYGDILKVRGRLAIPENIANFDYKTYLANRGISSVLRFPERVTLVRADYHPVLSPVYQLRRLLSRNLQSQLPEPHAALAQGILLGIRTSIPKELSDAFAHTGTTHVLAISGQNLTILAGLMTSLGIWLLGRRRQLYVLLALAMVWFYALLTGFVPSVARATVMATIFLAAHLLGRPRSGGPAMVFAAGLMVGWQPSILSDISFQLSFLAIIGLIYLAPCLQSPWSKLSENRSRLSWWQNTLVMILDSLAISLAATLFTLPVLVYHFHTLSLVSLPATLFLLPVLPAIILLSGATALIGLASAALAPPVAWVAWLPLAYMVAIVTAFNGLPLAFISTGPVSPGFLAVYYVALAGFVWAAGDPVARLAWTRRVLSHLNVLRPMVSAGIISGWPKKLVVALLIVASFLVWVAVSGAPDGRLHLLFPGNEEGGSVLVRTPHGQNILIDGGPSPEKLNLALGRILPFWEKKIDLLVLTAPQASQLPGLINVLRRYQVGHVLEIEPSLLTGVKVPATYYEWRREVKNRNIPRTTAVPGQWIDLGEGHKLQVLYAPVAIRNPTVPGTSVPRMVLRLEAGQVSFLLTPPVSKENVPIPVARRITPKSTVLRADLKASEARTYESWLQAIAPQVIVVSRSLDGDSPSPFPPGIPVLTLSPSSTAIELITDGENLWFKQH